MADPTPVTPPASPTGIALVKQWAVKLGLYMIGAGTVGVAALVMVPDSVSWKSQAMAAAVAIGGLGAALAGSGPGLRKTGADAAAQIKTVQDAADVLNRPPPGTP